jgi:hypothetical protein
MIANNGIRVVSQRSWVRFPLWSGKLFSLPGVDAHRSTGRGGGRGGSCPPKKITKSKSRANVQKPPVSWANKGSRAIFASQSGNIGLLYKELEQIMSILWLIY